MTYPGSPLALKPLSRGNSIKHLPNIFDTFCDIFSGH